MCVCLDTSDIGFRSILVCVCVFQAATTACTCYCSGPSPQTLNWQEVGTFSVSDPYFCGHTACQNSYPSSCNSAAQGCSTTSPCGVSALLNDLSLQCGLSGTVRLPTPTGGGQWHYTETLWLQGTIAVLECPFGTDGRSSTLVSFPDAAVPKTACDRIVLNVRQGSDIYSGVTCRGGQWSPAPSSLSAVCTRTSLSDLFSCAFGDAHSPSRLLFSRAFGGAHSPAPSSLSAVSTRASLIDLSSPGFGDAHTVAFCFVLQHATCTQSTPSTCRLTADLRANGVGSFVTSWAWNILIVFACGCFGSPRGCAKANWII